MDLSKAFDCLPHDILLCKLSAYGLADGAVQLMKSYLSNRKQRIKIGAHGLKFIKAYHKGPYLGLSYSMFFFYHRYVLFHCERYLIQLCR